MPDNIINLIDFDLESQEDRNMLLVASTKIVDGKIEIVSVEERDRRYAAMKMASKAKTK